jgi:sigma-B regulation protein RsbU (phosphoserine phosphatase)
LKNRFFENLSLLILYLFVFLFLAGPLSLRPLIAFLTVAVPGIWFDHYIRTAYRSVIYRSAFILKNKMASVLDTFNSELNRINDFHEMVQSLADMLGEFFGKDYWCLYVLHRGEYVLTGKLWPGAGDSIPEVLNIVSIPRRHQMITAAELNLAESNELSKRSELFPDQFIILEGKEDVQALIGVQKASMHFLVFPEIRPLYERVIRKTGQMLENARFYTESVEQHKQIQRLIEISEKLLSSLSTNQILTSILDALNDLIQFDAGVIFLLDEDSKLLHPKASRGYANEVDLTLKVGQGACGWVAEHKQISLLIDVNTSDHYFPVRPETRSQVTLPLMIQEELMGVLCLESNIARNFDEKSLEILKIFANLAVIALNNARQYEISLAKKSLENEMIKAGIVQKVLLPRQPPVYKKLSISFEHIASEIVSGDLFDLVPLNEQLLGLLIGDVSGKGAHAAIMMSLVLAGFRAFRKTHLEVCEVVARLNNLLQESISDGRYATLFYCMISVDADSITYTNAGHNPPVIIRADGSTELLSGGGIVLGYLPNESYTQNRIAFTAGDTLVCYTDGVTEAMDRAGEEFGETKFQNLLIANRHLSAYEMRNTVLKELKNFTHTKKLSDDITLLIVKHL